MTAPATVSVIMPCRNGRAFLERGIASVLDQRFRDLELLFIDDGSVDGSGELASATRDTRLRVLRVAGLGVSGARNRGLAEACGRLVAFLDVDDTWHADFLAAMTDELERRPECALAYCGWQNVGLPGGRGEPYLPPALDGMGRPEELLASCPWPIHAALTRIEAVRAANGFEPALSVAEDFLLWLEVACFHPIARVARPLAYYHHHGPAQASRHALRAAMHPLAAQRLFLSRHPDIAARLGRRRARELTLGRLLRKGYESYWRGDLDTARAVFRRVLRGGYGGARDWAYMLPALLPAALHRQALGAIRALKRYA
jgi:glycosyltransferase involved in cell wall biosynthesis